MLASLLRIFQAPSAPAEGSPAVDGVPAEIWYLIATFLPLSSQASLAFSCRLLFRYLGPASFEALKLEHHEQLRYMQLADRKHPFQWFCCLCRSYHWRWLRNTCSKYPLTPVTVHLDKTRYSEGVSWMNDAIRPVRFREVQMAARAARFGKRFGSRLKDYELDFGNDWHFSFSNVFTNDHLLIKFSTTKLISRGSMTSSNGEALLEDIQTHMAHCGHYSDELYDLIHCVQEHVCLFFSPAHLCRFCQPLLRCHTCATEYLVRAWLTSSRKILLNISRWSDLGDGLSPFSREWDGARYYGEIGTPTNFFEIDGSRSIRYHFEKAKTHLSPPEDEAVFLDIFDNHYL